MDFEMIKLCTGFLKSSMGLQSIQDLVSKKYAAHPERQLIQIHLTMFHATCMAIDYNEGKSAEEMQTSSAVKARFAQVLLHSVKNIDTGIYSKREMVAYNESLCSDWFCCGFSVADFPMETAFMGPVSSDSDSEEERQEETQTKFGEGILETAKVVGNYLYQKASSFTTGTIEFFLQSLHDAICKAFAPWLPSIKGALGWFGNIVEKLKQWATSIHDSIHGIFSGIEECIFLGVGLVAATCIVALIEKFLVATSLITQTCGAPAMFLTAALAVVATMYCAGKAVEKTLPIAHLLSFVTSSCNTVLEVFFRGYSKDPTKYQGEFGPSTMLESLAKTVHSWSTSSVTEVGKTFGAISQIKNGIVALKDMVVYVLGELGKLASKVLGFESQVLADMSILLGENVAEWLDECDAMVEYALEFNANNREVFDRLAQLIEKGRAIRSGVLRTNHRGSPQVLSLVGKALEKLVELHASILMAGSNGSRKAPFMLFFTGKAGTGKTSVVQRLATSWLQQEQLGAKEVYSRNGLDPFWSGYKRQAVVTYDDFGAVPGNVSNEAEIISVISRNPHALQMADLKDKGMYFDSRLVIASSNFVAANPESGVHDSEAYERRRHMVVRVLLKPGVAYNPSNPTENQMYVHLDSKSPFSEIQRFDSYEELWSYAYTKFKEHEENEKDFLASLPVLDSNEKEALEALVGMSVMMSSIGPKPVAKYCSEHFPGFHYLIANDDLVYFWAEDDKIKIVEIDKIGLSQMEKTSLQRDSLASAVKYQNMAKIFPTLNPLAVLYAKNIVLHGWVGKDLEPTGDCTDSYMREQIARLPTWQRAYLYVLGCHLKKQGARGWFASCLDDAKSKLRSQYIWEYKHWPMALKLAVGSFVALFAGSAIFYTLKSLWNVCGDSSFIIGAATIFSVNEMQGQSDPPNRTNGDFMFRNRKVQSRAWKGQACFGDSASWIANNCMGTLKFSGTKAQVCLMPGRGFLCINHLAQLIPNNVMVQLESSLSSTWFVWEKAKLKTFEGNELALYESKTLPKTVDSLVDRIKFDAESLPENFEALFFSYKYDEFAADLTPAVAGIKCAKKSRAFTVEFGEYRRNVPHHIEYQYPTENGDCGSLILAEIDGKYHLVGIHVAGNGVAGSACFIPSSESFFVKTGQSDFVLNATEWAEPKVLGPGCRAIGVIQQEHVVASGGKTSFQETPQDWHLDKPCDKLPSVLKKGDPRLVGTEHADYDPFYVGMTKYAQEAGPFDAGKLDRICADIVEEWFDASADFTFEEVDLQTALNGIENMEYFDALVMGTSEGFPYRLDRKHGEKGKSRYVSGDAGNMEITDEDMLKDIAWFEETSKTRIPDIYCIECVKDERLPTRKVLKEPKSRLFSVLPMSFNLVIRKKFLNFVKFIMKRRDVLPCQVGINPYSREWSRLAEDLLGKGNNILCCDYSRFDGFLPKCIMKKIANMIAELSECDPEATAQMENLMLACTSRYAICDKILYRVENGIPSGFPMTVIVNSILNEILVKYAYHCCFEENKQVQNSFKSHVKMVVYGDDNLISVSSAISSQFNGEFLVSFMGNLGIKVTDGVDKTKVGISFRRLEDCDFLKRSFRETKEGLWKAPMSRESLWPQLHFVKAKKIEMVDAYVNNCNNILRELWLHSAQEAKNFRSLIFSRLKWIRSEQILTMAQIEEFHREQMSGKTSFMSACFALDNLDLIDPLEPGSLPLTTREILPNVFVATEGRFVGNMEDYYVVSISTSRKFKSIEDGVVVTFPFGVGRGGLPTAQFLRQNLMRKGCALQKCILRGYELKGKLLFMSQNSVVPGYVFSILLLSAVKEIPRGISNIALTSAIQVCKNLKYLPNDFPECF